MKCKKCNSSMIKYSEADSFKYICPICDEEPATQNDDLIEFDSNKYKITITIIDNPDISYLKKISQICVCNMLQAKKIVTETGYTFQEYDALDTREIKKKLDEYEIAYSISPEFHW